MRGQGRGQLVEPTLKGRQARRSLRLGRSEFLAHGQHEAALVSLHGSDQRKRRRQADLLGIAGVEAGDQRLQQAARPPARPSRLRAKAATDSSPPRAEGPRGKTRSSAARIFAGQDKSDDIANAKAVAGVSCSLPFAATRRRSAASLASTTRFSMPRALARAVMLPDRSR
jgi:hypothetical protein